MPTVFLFCPFSVYIYPLRQMAGAKIIRMGKISSLPKSISKQSTSLEKPEKKAKFSAGPTMAKPGPTLLMQVTTEVTLVIKS